MSDRLQRNIDTLKVLHKCPADIRQAILENSPNELVCCLCEVIHNFLQGNIPVKSCLLKRMKLHKETLCNIANTKCSKNKVTSIKKKRELLVQTGGFLPFILGPLLGIATSLIGDLISK